MHLEDAILDALLDDALSGAERRGVDQHLASCTACVERLAARRRWFALIESAPDATPARELRGAVVAVLRPRPSALPRWAVGLTVVETLVAVALVVVSLTWIGPDVINRHLGSLTSFGLQTGLSGVQTVLDSFFATGDALVDSLTLGPGVAQSAWLLALASAAAALGLFGNGLWFALNWGKVRKL